MLYTLKNNKECESPILMIRDELGLTMKELCLRAECSPSDVYGLAYGTVSPVYIHTGEVKPKVMRLCKVLMMDVEDLFPRVFCKFKGYQHENDDLAISSYTQRISMDPCEIYEEHEIVSVLISGLPKRVLKILYQGYVLGMSQVEIADELGIAQGRMTQLFNKWLSRLLEKARALNVDQGN